MSTTSRDFCLTHRTFRPAGEPCPQCIIESDPNSMMRSTLPAGVFAFCPDHDLLYRIGVQCPLCQRARRDDMAVLDGRISDLSAENQDLRRRVTALEHQLLRSHDQANREARGIEHAQRLIDTPAMRADIREAAQRYIDRVMLERAERGAQLP